MAKAKQASKSNGSKAVTVTMQLEKVTPGAVRYQEVDAKGVLLKRDEEGMVLGTLYVRKSGIGVQGEKAPAKLTVTIVTIE